MQEPCEGRAGYCVVAWQKLRPAQERHTGAGESMLRQIACRQLVALETLEARRLTGEL
jgi:hypothetical protein